MESSMWKKAGKFLREQGKNKRWRKVLAVLGAGVVVVTGYAMLRPALTMEGQASCGLEEHMHTDACYGQALICGKVGAGDDTKEPITTELHCTFAEELHEHTDGCYGGDGEIVCGYVDFAVHAHTDACYENGELICPLSEAEEHEHTENCYRINDSGYVCGQEESESHAHTDACYTEHSEMTCGQEESEGHTHGDECYTEEQKLICGTEEGEEHTHDDSCYETVKEQTCGQEEGGGHQHDDSCYTTERELTCGQEEKLDSHTHTEACRGVVKELVCGEEEVILHEHGDGCYEENPDGERRLVCDLPEIGEHTHGEECFQEHEHTEDCYEEGMICGLEEHIHTDECNIGITYCGLKSHIHDDKCYEENEAGERVLACGLEEHTHIFECYISPEVSEEDRERILMVARMIEELPTYEELGAQLEAYDAAGDEEGYEAYYVETAFEAGTVYNYYEELDELQQYVANAQKLIELSWLWESSEMSLVSDTKEWTIYAVNCMGGVDTGCYLVHGDNKKVKDVCTTYPSVTFAYCVGFVVEPEESEDEETGKYVISEIYPAGSGQSKNEKEIPKDGCILFINSNPNTEPFIEDIEKGDYVEFNLKVPSFKDLILDSSPSGFGTVAIGSEMIGPKEPRNNDVPIAKDVASTAELIEINLYDYGTNINDLYRSDKKYPGFQQDGGTLNEINLDNYPWGTSYNFGNNITSDLKVPERSLVNKGGSINAMHPDGADKPLSGLNGTTNPMSPNLSENGYPQLSDGTSLDYLFSSSSYATRKNGDGLDGLFRHNEETGAYTFNSRENHAEFDGNNRFIVYDALISSNYMMYPFGNFLPFNSIRTQTLNASEIDRDYFLTIAATAKVKAEENALGLGDDYLILSQKLEEFVAAMDKKFDGKTWGGTDAINAYFKAVGIPKIDWTSEELEKIYSIDYDEATNFFFGMTMEMNFRQPANGLTGTTGDIPMEFYFTGDDDVWVYVDGMMFMNLSGIHRHVGGTLDFVNGKIHYYDLVKDNGDVSTTANVTESFEDAIRRALEAQGKTGEQIKATLDRMLKTDASGNYTTFKDNSAHNFKFYYMERGAGSGVCRMNFNFPLLKKNTLAVGKELSVDNEEVEELLGNPDFMFQVLEADGDGKKPAPEAEKLFVKEGTSYNVMKLQCSEDTSEGHLHEDGCYSKQRDAKAGPGGIITLKAGEYAVFPDISVVNNGYYIRELFDSALIEQYGTITASGQSTTKRGEVIVGEKSFIGMETDVYYALDGNTFFTFDNKVTTEKLGKLKITKELDNNGIEDAADSEFSFEVTLDGELLKAGTPYQVTVPATEDSEASTVERAVEEAGVIKLKAGETALLENILAGTKYTVQETSESADGYTVEYESPKDLSQILDSEKGQYVSGIISIYDEDETKISITVTNSTQGISLPIPIRKLLSNPNGESHTYGFRLEQVGNADGEALPEGEAGTNQSISITLKGDTPAESAQETAEFKLSYLARNLKEGEQTFYYRITEITASEEMEELLQKALSGETAEETSRSAATQYDESAYVVEVLVTRSGAEVKAEIGRVYKVGKLVTAADKAPVFQNTLLHDLAIRKLASGGNSKEMTFTFEITLTGSNDAVKVDGTYQVERIGTSLPEATPSEPEMPEQPEEITFQGGKAEITLKADETLIIKGLPYGVTWKVAETSTDGYYISYIAGPELILAVTDEQTEETEQAEAEGSLQEDMDSVTFINRSSYKLPEAGGRGTTIFYVLGGIMVLGAGTLLIVKKRMNDEK